MKTLIGLLALLSFVSTSFAAHSFHVEDLQKLSRISGPKVSPDGKWVAFTVARNDVEKNKSATNVWMVAMDGGEPRQLTFADQDSTAISTGRRTGAPCIFSVPGSTISSRFFGCPLPEVRPSKSRTFLPASRVTCYLPTAKQSPLRQTCFLLVAIWRATRK